MDDPRIPVDQLRRALHGLTWTNRRLGGKRALVSTIAAHLAALPAGHPIDVLDVGTGAGDLPLALVACGRRLGRRVEVTAVDSSPAVLAFAAKVAAGESSVRLLCANARRLPFAPRSFDLVTASLFLHHFEPQDVASLLRAFAALARRAVIVNDLRRHVVPWLFIAAVSRLAGHGAAYAHDAPLSVRRGFTATELLDAARSSGARRSRIRRLWPYRLVLEIDAGAGA